MTSIAQLSQQLATLTDSLRQTQTLISRLSKLTFQPGSEALDESAGSARLELAQDIHDSIKELDGDLELLRSELDDLNSDTGVTKRKGSEREQERERLNVGLTRCIEDIQQARGAFRRAQLNAKRASEAAKAQERQLVFASLTAVQPDATSDDQASGRGHRRQRTQQLSKDEIVVNASSDVTAALRRTHDLLSTELSRSRFAQETFDESTEALKELGEKYNNLDTILSNSKSLLSTLLRSQKSDTWYLETAFYLLLTTLIWLVFRRVLYGPFVKLPLFLWNVFAFTANWTILRPLYLLLTLSGVIRSEPTPLKPPQSQISTTRTPLIIQPSASDFPSEIPGDVVEQIRMAGGMPAGAGGAGAKVGKDGALTGQISESIGRLADESAKEAQDQAANEPVRRGDGTILQDRADIPKNPKKKTFEDDGRQGQRRDEL
ncbi:hypothetical protein AMS68_000957 [Peltaster fructicola]|uniref:Sec20 C-terminal domain-containing protein n=1 Tax=Peltaster fructicola TaxID=286661 RepID=A0A6H0XLR1_9PEZI|nr:hypothetical protein AMS68_000957 [Peltaster fructicola]